MYLTPVASLLLAVLTTGIEVGYLVGTEDVVHVLGEFGFEGGDITVNFLPTKIFVRRSCAPVKTMVCFLKSSMWVRSVRNSGM